MRQIVVAVERSAKTGLLEINGYSQEEVGLPCVSAC